MDHRVGHAQSRSRGHLKFPPGGLESGGAHGIGHSSEQRLANDVIASKQRARLMLQVANSRLIVQ